jgi:putative flippase GtrA
MGSFKKILIEKNHAGIQFLKYSICGGLAFVADITVFYLAAIFLFPALTSDDLVCRLVDLDVEPITRELRLRNFWIGKSFSFLAGNIVAYTLNVLFVFKSGRHKVQHEIALFLIVSFLAYVLSVASGDFLIRFFGVQTTISNLTAIIFATLFNYTGRKFFIFHG